MFTSGSTAVRATPELTVTVETTIVLDEQRTGKACAHFGCERPQEMRARGFGWCLTHGLRACARRAA